MGYSLELWERVLAVHANPTHEEFRKQFARENVDALVDDGLFSPRWLKAHVGSPFGLKYRAKIQELAKRRTALAEGIPLDKHKINPKALLVEGWTHIEFKSKALRELFPGGALTDPEEVMIVPYRRIEAELGTLRRLITPEETHALEKWATAGREQIYLVDYQEHSLGGPGFVTCGTIKADWVSSIQASYYDYLVKRFHTAAWWVTTNTMYPRIVVTYSGLVGGILTPYDPEKWTRPTVSKIRKVARG